ncbi:MAG TPA: hypothetical protein VF254_05380 [Gammaproteobacteria bacterium]
MAQHPDIPDGFYRLVKWREDGNPVFPSADTVVEVRAGRVINLSTGRSWPLVAMGMERSLYGPLNGPYDGRGLKALHRIDLSRSTSHFRENLDIVLPQAG